MAQQRTDKIRQRIIETAIALYNRERYGAVTTARLAREIGMADGNLWYHFNDKKALLRAIITRFSERIDQRLELRPVAGDSLNNYAEFLCIMASEMTDYLFLYRDQVDYASYTDGFMENVPGYFAQTHAQFSAYFEQMCQDGHLTLTPQETRALTHNTILVLRYYIDYANDAALLEHSQCHPIKRSLAQHLTVLHPYLTEGAEDTLVSALGLTEAMAECLGTCGR